MDIESDPKNGYLEDDDLMPLASPDSHEATRPQQPGCHILPVPPLPTSAIHSDDHSQFLRHFIGPMPYAIAAPQIHKTRRFLSKVAHGDIGSIHGQDGESVSDELLWRVIQRSKHASDWDRDMNPSRREELIHKLKRSVWSGMPEAIRKRERGTWTGKSGIKWVGESFQIGQDILGDNSMSLASCQYTESQLHLPDDNASSSPSGFSASRQRDASTSFPVQNGDQASSSSLWYESLDIESEAHDTGTSQFNESIETEPGRSDMALLPQPVATLSNSKLAITTEDVGKANSDFPFQDSSALGSEPRYPLPTESRETVPGVNFANEENCPESPQAPPINVSGVAVSDQEQPASSAEPPMRGSVKAPS